VITQSMLSQQTNDLQMEQFAAVVRGLEELALHTRDLQESVMAIRMQPVKSVFARMPRLVRDLSAKLAKNVRLDVFGENTEVDTTIVEEISDPITHMIRNSLDHGLETEDERVAAGKPPQGVIRLSAEHRSGRIVIAIEDDGRGINREKVLAKARERGIVLPDQTLTDDEIDNLIFAPGFSTAQAVTDVSGRGVGMDVVRRNVQALGGRVGIQNHPGKGTRFTMTLPLTLAVMDGMIVAAGGEKYVVPITAIVECMRPQKNAVTRLPTGMEVVHVRGEYIPLIYLARAFDLDGAILDPSEALVVLVDSDEKGRVGIVVDELLGQQQVVIKSLESNYDPVAGLSGATILGNGRVAPILDIEGLCGITAGVRSGAIRHIQQEAAA
ncbi:MAG: chemotaxis protein CheA, partial [Alphaproteobacteria bacterium]